MPRGEVRHFLPGQSLLPGLNPKLTDRFGTPFEARLGGSETMYPEYIAKMKTFPRPEGLRRGDGPRRRRRKLRPLHRDRSCRFWLALAPVALVLALLTPAEPVHTQAGQARAAACLAAEAGRASARRSGGPAGAGQRARHHRGWRQRHCADRRAGHPARGHRHRVHEREGVGRRAENRPAPQTPALRDQHVREPRAHGRKRGDCGEGRDRPAPRRQLHGRPSGDHQLQAGVSRRAPERAQPDVRAYRAESLRRLRRRGRTTPTRSIRSGSISTTNR